MDRVAQISQVAASIILLAASLFAATPHWTAATFHGLSVGHAKRDDVLRVLGSPSIANRDAKGEELVYRGRGDHKGDISVKVDGAGVVTEVQESFPISIPRTQIYKELGKDAMTAHFSRAKCAGDELYVDPRGPIELTLFPQHGIVLWPDQYGYDFAAMLYVAKRPGLARVPVCAKKR